MRRISNAAAAVVVLVGSCLISAARPVGAALVAATDYNCDGVADLAVGAPGASVASGPASGAVVVFFGSDSGLAPAGMLLSIGLSGTPGVAAAGDAFGLSIASGSFNTDSCTDLAVGAPGVNPSSTPGAGAVYIFFGSESGFDMAHVRRLVRGTTGIPGANQTGAQFGRVLAAGDANGDFTDDLAIGAPTDDVGAVVDAGSVTVVSGPGLHSNYTATQFVEGVGGVPGPAVAADRFGASLAFGNFAFSGLADFSEELAIGVPGRDADGVSGSGGVAILPTVSSGLTGVGSRVITQDSSGVPGASEPGDNFGASLAAGPIVGDDDADDLAIGAPNEDLGVVADAGDVVLLGGGTAGPGGTGAPAAALIYQQVPGGGGGGVAGVAEASDHFGTTLLIDHFSATPTSGDLAVGVPYEDIGAVVNAGGVAIIPGSGDSLTLSSAVFLYQNHGGVPGTSEAGDLFGYRVAAGDWDASGSDDLAVGSPYEDVGSLSNAGTLTIVNSGAAALDPATSGAALLSQNSAGIPGVARAGAHFGYL